MQPAAEVLEQDPGRIRLRDGDATVEVTALAPDTFRIGYFPLGRPVHYASEATDGARWEPPDGEMREHAGTIELATGAATAHIALDPLRIGFRGADGRRFAQDLAFSHGTPRTAVEGAAGIMGPPVALEWARGEGERFFGCGERTSGLERTGSRVSFWNIDPPMGHTPSFDNLYTSIPFVLSLQGGLAHGVFLDNTHRVEADLAKTDPGRVRFEAAGGDVVAYVFAGPAPRDVLARYTQLTGRVSLPPLWALGNQQSRWGYRSADELRAIAREFRARDIPCDVLYLDIDYMEGYRVFTWDQERFPDPAGLLAELGEQGFRVVTIVDPGVKVDEAYAPYTEGRAGGFFCRTFEDEEYRNVVWPGLCAFPDFTNPATRAWWGDRHAALLDAGVAGIWCDMNEPALFVPAQSTMPDDVVHPGGGDTSLHGQVHNSYGSLMARATREGIARARPDRRPFVITRSGFAGLQRHALQWTGDNSSWWEHLWMAMPQLQTLGLSGVAFCGVDVGGFFGDVTPELLARWTEFGVLQPFCRNHAHADSTPQEPWRFGEPYESICRDMIALRMRLLPYLYGLFEESSRTGAPVLRPLLFEHPDDPVTYASDDEFLLGDALLAAPITRPGVEHRHVYLPAGSWLHWWTGERIDGPEHVLAHAPLGRPALYARANAAIPLWPALQHTSERAADPLTLRIACAPGAAPVERELYEDAGEGYGAAARTTVRCSARNDLVRVELGSRRGDYAPPRETVRLEFHGIGDVAAVSVDGAEHDFTREPGGPVVVALADGAEARVVEARTR